MNNDLISHMNKIMDAINHVQCQYKVVFNINSEGSISATVELFGDTKSYSAQKEAKKS